MKKQLFLSACLLILKMTIFGQSISSNHFEVFTKPAYPHSGGSFSFNRDSILTYIQNIPDSLSNYATFVMAAGSSTEIDSIFYTLINSQGQIVYTGALSYVSLSSNSSFRMAGDVLYWTVGPYQYLKRFTATAKIKYINGAFSTERYFVKN